MLEISGTAMGLLQSGQLIVAPTSSSSATRCLPQTSHLKKMSSKPTSAGRNRFVSGRSL
jgi:hypothetical protein